MIQAFCILGLALGALADNPSELLEQLRSLDRELVQLDYELGQLRSSESVIENELAALRVSLSETQLHQNRVMSQLRKRVRKLSTMSGGARMLALGQTGSLGEYLEVSRMIRWVASHDQSLRQSYQSAANETRSLLDEQALKSGILKELRSDIEARQEHIGRQHRERVQQAQMVLSTPKSVKSLSREQARAYAQLEKTFSKLQVPGQVQGNFSQNKTSLPWPVVAPIAVGFGGTQELAHGTRVRSHGLLLRPAPHALVQSVFSGTVVYSDWFEGYGQLVIVDHGDGYHTLYAHLGTLAVTTGESVATGTSLGTVGQTGSISGTALYFELRANAVAQDPMAWLKR